MKYLVFITALITGMTVSAEVYRWEENGRVYYSDKPHHKAKKIKLKGISTYKARNIHPRFTNYHSTAKKDPGKTYQLSVISPAAEQTVFSDLGKVTIRFGVSPPIKGGHKIQYSVSASSFSGETSSQALQLKNVDRGEHVVTARVVDARGVALSPEVRSVFYMRRPSILHPLIKKNLSK